MTISLIGFFLFFACGCDRVQASKNVDNLNLLKVGMTKEQVIQIMGKPNDIEVFRKIEVLYYLTDAQFAFGGGTSGCTPIVIDDNKVIGWGPLSRQSLSQ